MSEATKRRLEVAGAWREARSIIASHRSRLVSGAFLMTINLLLGFVMPAASKYVIDEIIIKGRTETLAWVGLAAGAAIFMQVITAYWMSQILSVAGQRVITDMRKRVQAHVGRLPVNYFDATQTGMLITRIMSDAEGLRVLVGNGLIQLGGNVVTALASIGILFWLDWRLTTLMIIVLLTFGVGMSYAFKKMRPLFRERGELNSQLTGRLAQSLVGVRVVKAYAAEKREELAFARGAHRLFRTARKAMTGASMVAAFSSVLVGAASLMMILEGGRSVLNGRMTLGDLFMYIFLTGLMVKPITEVAGVGTQITEAVVGLDRIREILSLEIEEEGAFEMEEISEIRGEIVFENVWFEYNAGAPVLKNLSFKAPAGSTTALVGSSGSGKSTLINLVMKFNQPKTGRVIIDGRDLSTIKLHAYRSLLGVVLQDNFLFDDTIAENIRFSKPGASIEEIQAVSRIAHCEEFIEGFDQKYETIVGERGVKLSGGQRQRIAIARALLADPKLLILDEATSSLDNESEALVQEGLRSLRKGRTTFVIAHRLSTIQNADLILVLENGEIVEQGAHDALLAAGGRYKQLYDRRSHLERNHFIDPLEHGAPGPPMALVSQPASTEAAAAKH
jgi:ABC-type multidrug transport system fused ATPase/permease subunit